MALPTPEPTGPRGGVGIRLVWYKVVESSVTVCGYVCACFEGVLKSGHSLPGGLGFRGGR